MVLIKKQESNGLVILTTNILPRVFEKKNILPRANSISLMEAKFASYSRKSIRQL